MSHFLEAFARAAANLPKLTGFVLWTPIKLSLYDLEREFPGFDPESISNHTRSCQNGELAWGIAYSSPGGVQSCNAGTVVRYFLTKSLVGGRKLATGDSAGATVSKDWAKGTHGASERALERCRESGQWAGLPGHPSSIGYVRSKFLIDSSSLMCSAAPCHFVEVISSVNVVLRSIWEITIKFQS